ncbi:MAG TPA: peptidoglycan DD-metalloendopeptidase family protein [Promicromonospora sp.]|nr:peptidoglycan DD-metalloendopeptidase family protein [Promicromonospora sp.]
MTTRNPTPGPDAGLRRRSVTRGEVMPGELLPGEPSPGEDIRGEGARSARPGRRARHGRLRWMVGVVVTALLVGWWAPWPAAALRSGPDVAVRTPVGSTAGATWQGSESSAGGARGEAGPGPLTSPGSVDDGTSRTGTGPHADLGYVAPVAGVDPPLGVERRFDPPEHEWGPGHRGVDLTAAVGALVLAPGAGVVSFSGRVAGRGVVVVTHPDGLRSSLEPVTAAVPAGTAVAAGAVIGAVEGGGPAPSVASHCAPRSCLHWGVRRGERYLDPLALLHRPPIVLLPDR